MSKIVQSLNDKRIPCIPPIIHDSKFLTDFSKKADLFNSLFTKTKLMKNSTSVLENNTVLLSSTNPANDQYLSNNEFTKGNIEIITYKLDPNKSHGHDMISICMLKMSGDAIIEPLFTIFNNYLKCGIFSDDRKK